MNNTRGKRLLAAAIACIIAAVVYWSFDWQCNVFISLLIGGFGAVLLVLAISFLCRPDAGRIVRRCLAAILAVMFCTFGILEALIISAGGGDYSGKPDVIIVPGAALQSDGTPGLTLETRLAAALEQLNHYPDCIVVVSGGQGTNEINTEAVAMANWLEERGIAAERMLQEDAARNSSQNITFSLNLLESEGYDLSQARVLIVSNDYHLFRTGLLAKQRCAFVSTLGVPAVTLVSMIYNYSRESVAVLKELLLLVI